MLKGLGNSFPVELLGANLRHFLMA